MVSRLLAPGFLVSLVLLLAPPARAGDVWVDAVNGSDANGGTSESDAWRTITHALVQLGSVPGIEVDIVHVLPGVYNAMHGESFPIELRDRVRLVGEMGPETTIIDGGINGGLAVGVEDEPTGPETGAEGLSVVSAKTGILLATPLPDRPVRQATFRNMFLVECGSALRVRTRGTTSAGSSIVLEDSRIVACGNPVDARALNGSELTVTVRGVTVEKSGGLYSGAYTGGTLHFAFERSRIWIDRFLFSVVRLEGNGQGGRTLAQFRDSEVVGFCLSSYGLFLEAETVIERCTISGHDTGVALFLPLPMTVRDSILYGNYADLKTPPGWSVTVERTDLDDRAYTGKNGNFTLDPLFVDPEFGDFRLRYGSPCVDRLPVSSHPDRTGRSRDVDGTLDTAARTDLGANELRTLDGPATVGLGELFSIEVHGGAGEAAVVLLSRAAPLAAPMNTAYGVLWLEPGTFKKVAVAQTSGGLATSVLLTAPDHPSLVGVTLGVQAFVTSPSAPLGAAWSSVYALALR